MSLENENQKTPTDDEIDLMDLALILSENLKILLIFPLIGILCAGGFLFLQTQKPATFVSQASLSVESFNPDHLRAAEVLVSAINTGDALGDLKSTTGTVTATLGRADKLVQLSATASSAEAAHALNQVALEKIYAFTTPTGSEPARLRQVLSNERSRLLEIQKLIAQTEPTITSSAEDVRAYGELLDIASKREFAIAKIEHQLSGLSPSNLVLAPTYPSPTYPSPKRLLALIAGLVGGGVIALIWIFGRHAMSKLRDDEKQVIKLQKIKANLGFKK